MSDPDIRCSLIGLGVMGQPMAGHLLRSLGRLTVNSRRRISAAELESAGATWAATPREAAAAATEIVVVVPTIADIRDLLDGVDGLLAGLREPSRLIVCSTTSSQEVRDLQADLDVRAPGLVSVVDAPVSGGEEGARAGSLSIMVGGEPGPAARTVSLLSACGRAVHLGPLGAGQVAKACNQLIVAATVTACAEAAVIAERAGLDIGALFDLLGGGYAGSRIMQVKGPRFAAHDHSPSGPARFLVKDLRAVAEEAERGGVQTYLTEPLRTIFAQLTEEGLGDLDTAVVQRFVEQHSTR